MASGLIPLIKQACREFIENAQMCDLRYGEVVSVNPLRVKVTSNLTIPSSVLIVPEHLTDRVVTVSNDGIVEDGQTMVIHNALKIGDRVALLRKQGGQSYFILDRI